MTAISPTGAASDALRGVRVLDLGQYVAGPLTALMLAQQGAEVIRVEPPGGPRWTSPVNEILLEGRASTLVVDLSQDAGRRQVADLAASSDVLVEGFRPGVMARLGLSPEALAVRHPGLVYCSLPGFGRDDPRAGLPGWEGAVLAAAGCYATGSKEMLKGEWWPTSGPAFTPLMLASVFAGSLGAVGVLAALLARESDGLGQHVEVPLYDAFFEGMGARLLRYERKTPGGSMLGSGFYRCRDDRYVSLVTVWHRHLEWFLQAAGQGDWVDEGIVDYDRLRTDDAAQAELSRRLIELFATRDAADWEQLAHAAGVPLGAVRTPSQWRAEALQVAPSTVANDRPAPLIRLRDHGPAATGGSARTSASDGPLAGTRVLDMTRVLAAPTVARILAELGADVVKADVAPGAGRAGLREPFFHEAVNRGKQLTTVDVHETAGREELARLCAASDVLVTNFTPPALRRLGVDEEQLRDAAPHLIYAYVNAFGTTGPWAHLRGYAEIANTVTGVTARTLGAGPPSGVAPNVDLPRAPTTDYAAGVIGAFGVLVGLYRRGRTGRSSVVETSLVDAACLEQIAQLYDSDAPDDTSGALGWSELQRLYRTTEGWIFLGAAEARRTGLLTALGLPADAGVDDLEQRFAELAPDDAAALAASAGAVALRVEGMDTLLDEGGVADRLGIRLAQESPTFGTVVQPGPVIRMNRTPMRPGDLPDPPERGHAP